VNVPTSIFPEVVSEIDANPEHRRAHNVLMLLENYVLSTANIYEEHRRAHLYTRALLLLRRPPCWNKHGPLDTLVTMR